MATLGCRVLVSGFAEHVALVKLAGACASDVIVVAVQWDRLIEGGVDRKCAAEVDSVTCEGKK